MYVVVTEMGRVFGPFATAREAIQCCVEGEVRQVESPLLGVEAQDDPSIVYPYYEMGGES